MFLVNLFVHENTRSFLAVRSKPFHHDCCFIIGEHGLSTISMRLLDPSDDKTRLLKHVSSQEFNRYTRFIRNI